MCTITSFQFDIYPLSYPGQGFSRLYGYIFQGILMKWLKSVNPDFASKLHKMKDEKGNNLKRKYSIQYKRIRKNSLDQYQKPGQQLEECLGKCKSSSLKKKTSESAQRVSVKGKCNGSGQEDRQVEDHQVEDHQVEDHQVEDHQVEDRQVEDRHNNIRPSLRKHKKSKYYKGVKFIVNSANNELSRILFNLHLNSKLDEIHIGKRLGQIADITISYHPLEKLDFEKNHPPIKEFSLEFHTPTSFSVSGREEVMCLPLSHYVFGNLARQWNNILSDSSNPIPPEFYTWVKKHVAILYHSIQTKTWHRGKQRKFIGFTGWTKYKVLENRGRFSDLDNKFRKMIPILVKFGEFMNLGRGRTAGFGNFRLKSKKIG